MGQGRGISAKLFCKHSQVAFMPYGVVLKDEHRTSDIERPITPGREKNKHPIPNIQRLFLFLFSRFYTRNENLNSSVSCKISFSSTVF